VAVNQSQPGPMPGRLERPVRVMNNKAINNAYLVPALQRSAESLGHLTIIEAGCGRSWPLNLAGIDHRLVGIDIDEDGLAARTDLDSKVLADLRTVEMPEGSADVIYNAYVLEHVEGAEQVLDNFVRWLRPGGVLLLKIPDGESVFGWLAKRTPFASHVLVHRVVRRNKNAGKPGHAPFPTVYDPVVSRSGIHAYCAKRNLIIEEEVATNSAPGRLGRLAFLVNVPLRLMALASGGRLTAAHNNLVYVIRKPSD
jgi:SAM-dependent methyltransferase